MASGVGEGGLADLLHQVEGDVEIEVDRLVEALDRVVVDLVAPAAPRVVDQAVELAAHQRLRLLDEHVAALVGLEVGAEREALAAVLGGGLVQAVGRGLVLLLVARGDDHRRAVRHQALRHHLADALTAARAALRPPLGRAQRRSGSVLLREVGRTCPPPVMRTVLPLTEKSSDRSMVAFFRRIVVCVRALRVVLGRARIGSGALFLRFRDMNVDAETWR